MVSQCCPHSASPRRCGGSGGSKNYSDKKEGNCWKVCLSFEIRKGVDAKVEKHLPKLVPLFSPILRLFIGVPFSPAHLLE